jgi:hypothetical protein
LPPDAAILSKFRARIIAKRATMLTWVATVTSTPIIMDDPQVAKVSSNFGEVMTILGWPRFHQNEMAKGPARRHLRNFRGKNVRFWPPKGNSVGQQLPFDGFQQSHNIGIWFLAHVRPIGWKERRL